MTRRLSIGIGVLIIIIVLLYSAVGKLIFQPTRAHYTSISEKHKEGYITTPDGVKLNYWMNAEPLNSKTVLYLHGFAGNLNNQTRSIQRITDIGYNVLALDYRGYGKSTGKTTKKTYLYDATVAYAHLRRTINRHDIIVWGDSLGTVPAAYLASKHRIAGVILQSTFCKLGDVVRQKGDQTLVRKVCGDILDRCVNKYRPIDYIPHVRCPILFIHTKDDTITPYEGSIVAYNAVPAGIKKKHIIVEGCHSYTIFTPEQMLEIKSFFTDTPATPVPIPARQAGYAGANTG